MSRVLQYLLPLVILVLLCFSDASAQGSGSKNFPVPFGPNNAGREFYFTLPANWDEPTASQYYIRLYITSGVRTQVKVWVGPGIKKTFYTLPYDIVTVDLNPIEAQAFTRDDLAPVPDDQIYRNKAVHIEAGAPIVVYAMNRTSFTSDGILALPVNALGRDYVIASYAAVIGNAQQLPSQFVVVAPYDGTTVTINQPMETPNHAEGEQVTILLNKGDVYSAMTIGYGGDMSGAVIRASKPVAVLAGQNCTYIPNQIIYCCCDHLTEMMLPISAWGKFYQGVSYQGRLKGDFWRVFAGEENTTVYINGNKYAVLNKVGGEEGNGWLEYHATGPGLTEFTSDKPIYIAQYNTSSAYDGVQSDPFYLVLTPVEQYQTRLTFSTPSNDFPQNFINLVADSATYRQIEIAPGGTDKWQAVWKMPGIGLVRYFPTKVDGRTYLGVTINIPPGTYQMRGPVPFAGYIYGFSAYDSYGYPLSVATGDLSRPDTVAPEIRKKVDCNGLATVTTIDGPENPEVRTNLSTVELDPDGTFNYDLNVRRFEAGVTPVTDYTLSVINLNEPARAVVVISDMAGNLTLDTVIYNPFRVTITPSPVDFGNLITGETKRMKLTITNPSAQPVRILESRLKSGAEGFVLLSPTGPFVLGPAGSSSESIEAEIEFTATKTGYFQDSLGLRDTCGLRYLAQVEANVGKPVIEVTDKDFGSMLVGTTTGIWYMEVRNNTAEGGLLRVTGASGPTDNAVFTLPSGLPAFPFELRPGESKQIAVTFTAVAEQDYLDQIVFSSNVPPGPANDSIGVLKGKGVKTGLFATSFEWGRVRVGRQAVDTVVYLTNYGSLAVRILNLTYQGDVDDFQVLNAGQIEGRLIGAGKVDTVHVRFTPTAVGDREMTITYTTDPQQTDPVVSTLKGVGVEPMLATQDYDFGLMDLSDPEVNQKVHFWIPLGSAYRDTVTITGFRFRSDAGSGGQNDFRSIPLDTALRLIPGVTDTVEFTGFFQAQGVGARTAELEALTLDNVNVTSNWTGRGSTLSAGMNGDGGSINGVCVGDTAFLTATVFNTGQVDVFVDSMKMSSPDFEIVDPDPALRFRMRAGDPPTTIIIRYMPKVKEAQNANLTVYNSTGLALNLPISGTSIEDTIQSLVRLSGSKGAKTEFGDNMVGTISLANLPAGADISNYSVIIRYDTLQLVPRTDAASLKLGSANPTGGTVRVSSSSRPGRLVLDVTLPSGLTGAGDLLSVPFGVRFTTQMTRSIAARVIAQAPCLTIVDSNATIDVEPLCGLNLRMIEIASTTYALDQNKPNPFNPVTVIKYSLGLDGPTQVILFDASGKIVQQLVDEYQLPGVYELTLDVSNLPSGNYYYKLISGHWTETKMLTVVK